MQPADPRHAERRLRADACHAPPADRRGIRRRHCVERQPLRHARARGSRPAGIWHTHRADLIRGLFAAPFRSACRSPADRGRSREATTAERRVWLAAASGDGAVASARHRVTAEAGGGDSGGGVGAGGARMSSGGVLLLRVAPGLRAPPTQRAIAIADRMEVLRLPAPRFMRCRAPEISADHVQRYSSGASTIGS